MSIRSHILTHALVCMNLLIGVSCAYAVDYYGSTANCRKRPNTAATHPNTAGRFGAPRCRVGTPPLTSGMRQSEFQAVSL